MKILSKWTTGQNSSASARLASFKLKVSELFWKNCGNEALSSAKNKDNYFAINRAISDAFDKIVNIVEVSQHFRRDEVDHLQDRMDDFAVDKLSQLLAAEIRKHNFIPVTKDQNSLFGDVEYKLSVAFFILPNEENKD